MLNNRQSNYIVQLLHLILGAVLLIAGNMNLNEKSLDVYKELLEKSKIIKF